MLTSDTMAVPLNAARGVRPVARHAVFSQLWTQYTGTRGVGVTTSTNASYVLQKERLAKS